MNSDQQQLLQLLKIQTYQLHAEFSVLSQTSAGAVDPQQIIPTSDQTAASHVLATMPDVSDMMLTTANNQLQLDPKLQQLTQDILLLLQTEYPKTQWQASAQFQHCQLQGDLLQTPEIEALCSPHDKKQLWLQFIQPQEMPDVSDHSQSHAN
jgi:hypothetical protein